MGKYQRQGDQFGKQITDSICLHSLIHRDELNFIAKRRVALDSSVGLGEAFASIESVGF
jgi:hypothetical protein